MNKSRRVQTFAFLPLLQTEVKHFEICFFNPKFVEFSYGKVIYRIYRNGQHDISPFSTEEGNQMAFFGMICSFFDAIILMNFSPNTESPAIFVEKMLFKTRKIIEIIAIIIREYIPRHEFMQNEKDVKLFMCATIWKEHKTQRKKSFFLDPKLVGFNRRDGFIILQAIG